MPEIKIDPTQPIGIRTVFDTPLRITLEFQYCPKGQKKFTSFYHAAVAEEVPNQDVACTLDAQPKGSKLVLTMVFYGKKDTAFKGTIRLSQNGAETGERILIRGSTGDKLAKVKQVEVDLK